MIASVLVAQGRVLYYKGELHNAESALRQAQAICDHFGEEYPQSQAIINQLALVSRDMGDSDTAVELMRRSLDLRRRLHSPRHPSTLAAVQSLARLLEEQGDRAGTISVLRDDMQWRFETLPAADPILDKSVVTLMDAQLRFGDPNGASKTYRDVLEQRKCLEEHPRLLESLGRLYLSNGTAPLYEVHFEHPERGRRL